MRCGWLFSGSAALALVAIGSGVRAADIASIADMPEIRGSVSDPVTPFTSFAGFYVGAYGSYGTADVSLRKVGEKATRDLFKDTSVEAQVNPATMLRLGEDENSTGGGGVFAGVTYQYEDVAWGFEVDYTRSKYETSSSNSIARALTYSNAGTSFLANITQTGEAKAKITDYMSFRGRAGYIMGAFMPYVTGGFSVARTDVTAHTATTINTFQIVGTTNVPYATETRSFSREKKDKYSIGLTAGLGMDFAITNSFMLRAEYQFLWFPEMNGAEAMVNVLKAGGAVKF
jgi:outer membrane immunogenic protein